MKTSLEYEEGYTSVTIPVVIWNSNGERISLVGADVTGENADYFYMNNEGPTPEILSVDSAQPSDVFRLFSPVMGLAPGTYSADLTVYIEYSRHDYHLDEGNTKAKRIQLTVNAARPEFSLAPGPYVGPQQVSLSTISQGVVIHYTTDGSKPTAASPVYTGPITVSESAVIRAFACMEDSSLASEITQAAYTILQPSYMLNLTAPQFGEVTEGYDQPEAKPLTITSTGNRDAIISSVRFIGDGADAFILNRTDGMTVAAGSTDSATYTVQPAAGLMGGIYTAIIAVTYNDGEIAAAEVSFTVDGQRYPIYVVEDYRGSVTVIGPDTALPGSRVTFMAAVNNEYYDDYQLMDVTVTDTSGNLIEVDYWKGFVMPASGVWVRPVFRPLLPIAIELGDEVELPMGIIQTDSHGWGVENAKAAAGETVKMEARCFDNEYVIGSVTVTAADGSEVPCRHTSEYLTDMNATVSLWQFVMPNTPVTVRFVTVPAFGEADLVLPADLMAIGDNAFEGDTLLSAVDAGQCASIGAEAFKGCTGLSQILLPYSCRIDPTAFNGCGTVYVYAPSNGATEETCAAIENCVFVPAQ